ncbi:RDD family protein [Actinomadura craniellae]|uniref:RDD family protein n=1 Tax=Actinomadura craniellae TaxID=2231787 RepID=A0A365H226_9ACTN|nr:RDD family protein [Actinomadura craniellae]RAY13155.1 RDD family protein [Actinomadura craniellae]
MGSGGERREAERSRWTGSWLGGVRSAGVDLGYPGERLGLPEKGPGSVAGYGRRLVALLVDLLLAAVVAAFLARTFEWSGQIRSWTSTGVFALEVWLLTGLLGMSIGKRLCGIRVARLDGRPVGLGWSLVRTFLLLLIVPALLWDRDSRGLHDRAANTVVINSV